MTYLLMKKNTKDVLLDKYVKVKKINN